MTKIEGQVTVSKKELEALSKDVTKALKIMTDSGSVGETVVGRLEGKVWKVWAQLRELGAFGDGSYAPETVKYYTDMAQLCDVYNKLTRLAFEYETGNKDKEGSYTAEMIKHLRENEKIMPDEEPIDWDNKAQVTDSVMLAVVLAFLSIANDVYNDIVSNLQKMGELG